MFRLSSVNFSYGDKQILKDFYLTVNDGECIAIKGESGSGKTTAALILLGLRTVQSGEVIAPERISAVFQEDRFIESRSLDYNLKISLSKEAYEKADALLKAVNLYEYKAKKISEFSGGMKRRAALVRAVAFEGDGLIIDEVFNGIDEENKLICAEIIKKYFLDKNKPVLFIAHIDTDAKLLNAKIVNITKDR